MSAPENLLGLDQQTLELLRLFCDNRLTPAQAAELEERLLGHPERQYGALLLLRVHSELAWEHRAVASELPLDLSETMILSAIIEDVREDDAQAARAERIPRYPEPEPEPEPLLALLRRMLSTKVRRWQRGLGRYLQLAQRFNERLVYWMCAGATAALAVIIIMTQLSQDPIAARTIESTSAEWDTTLMTPFDSEFAHGTYNLRQGVVKMEFEGGALATLEGPCRFTLDGTTGMRLDTGVIYAEARGPEPEFTVTTPQAIVQDLGTAFGVAVDPDGSTETLVFEGRVTMDSARTPTGTPVVIPAAYRSRMTNESRVPEAPRPVTSAHDYLRFPREVARRIWLANLICEPESGDIGDCYCSIDMINGQRTVGDRRSTEGTYDDWSKEAHDRYVLTSQVRAIDGVFVPYQATGVVIDSNGSVFDGAAAFSRARTFAPLWVGRPFPMHVAEWTRTVQERRDAFTELGIGPHAIAMHAPKGFTVDLREIIAQYGSYPQRFRAALINAAIPASNATKSMLLDFWVLIDGQPVYHREGLSATDGFQMIDLTLPPGARFLTLISTIGPDESSYRDWAVLEKAYIELSD